MSEPAEPWATYQRFQQALMHRDHVDDVAWGLEAALDRCLDEVAIPDEIKRTGASASRKERHRAYLRRVYYPVEPIVGSAENAVIALDQLEQIRKSVSEFDWNILCEVADGLAYEEIAARIDTTPGALRVRVLRVRRRLRATSPH